MAAGDTSVAITEGSGKNIDVYETTAGDLRQRVIIAGKGTSDDVLPVAHDAADAGSPLKVGGKANQSVPTAVSDADRVDAWMDREGATHTVSVPETSKVWVPGAGRLAVSRATYYGTVTPGTGVQMVAAIASTYTYVVGFAVSSAAASGNIVRLLNGSAGTAIISFHTIQYQPIIIQPTSMIVGATSANTALYFDMVVGPGATICQVLVLYLQSTVSL